MLELRRSHELTPLLDDLAMRIGSEPAPFGQRDPILVPSAGLGRWLTLGLAERLGALAFTEMSLPAHFANRLCAELLDGEAPVAPGTRELWTWHLWKLLGDAPRSADDVLQSYLRDDPEGQKRYQLARALAGRFDDYAIYRPDLVHDWESRGAARDLPHEDWQKQLWCRLVAETGGDHLARRLAGALEMLSRSSPPAPLPQRVFAFGLTTLPPIFLDLLHALARWVPVTIYSVVPHAEQRCSESQLRGALAGLAEEFDELLSDHSAALDLQQLTIPAGYPGTGTALHRLQRRLLEVDPERVPEPGESTLDPADRSIVVHRAFSPRRELEIVADEILAAMDADATLTPGDIVVLLAEPEVHAPLVDAVFGSRHEDVPVLPYHLSDRALGEANAVAQSFVQLLQLPSTRLGRADVLSFLRREPVRRGCGFTQEDLERVAIWCEEMQVRWGVDGEERAADHDLPASSEFTWANGLERLLLGHACGEVAAPVLGRMPSPLVGEEAAETLGNFADFLRTLFRFVRSWRREQPLARWSQSLRDAASQLLRPEGDREESAMRLLLDEIARLQDCGEHADVAEPVPLAAVREWLTTRLADEVHGSPFVDGRLTIGALKPMRSIPFRMVCVVGLTQEAFPRRDRAPAFDLVSARPRAGDRTLRRDDRYLFLETLLAARERLVLGYAAFSDRDGSECAPSVCLSELLDDIDRFELGPEGVPASRVLTIDHPLHATSARYFDGRDPKLFSHRGDLVVASANAEGKRQPEEPWLSSVPSEVEDGVPDVIELHDLVRFWQHPCAWFLRNTLGIELPGRDRTQEDHEPFGLDGLARYQAGELVLDEHVRQRDAAVSERLRMEGLLPAGALGDTAFEFLAEGLGKPLAWLEGIELTNPRSFELRFGPFRVVGALDALHARGRIRWRFGHARPQDRIGLWIPHLALAAAARDGQFEHPVHSLLVTREERRSFGPVPDAAAILEGLCGEFVRGKNDALPVLPRASCAWAEQELVLRNDDGKRRRADPMEKARQQWRPDEFSKSSNDGDDPFLQLCFRGRDPFADEDLFRRLSELLWMPLLEAEVVES